MCQGSDGTITPARFSWEDLLGRVSCPLCSMLQSFLWAESLLCVIKWPNTYDFLAKRLGRKLNPYISRIFGKFIMLISLELPRWLISKESACHCRRCRFDPWVRKIPWRRKWQPTPVFLPGKSHGQWSLQSMAGYSPWGCKRVRRNLVMKQFL